MDGKKYELVFEHPSGLILSIATDDIYGLSEQPWFNKFFESANFTDMKGTMQQAMQQQQQQQMQQQQAQQYARVQRAQDPFESANPFNQQRPVQQQQPVQVPRPSYLDVHPNSMTPEIWSQFSDAQKVEWQKKWLGNQVTR